MLTLYYVIFIFMFLIGSIVFVLNRKHLLSMIYIIKTWMYSFKFILFIIYLFNNYKLSIVF